MREQFLHYKWSLKTHTAMRTLVCFGFCAGVCLSLLPSQVVFANDGFTLPTLKPRVELNARPGQDRSIYMTEMWVPFHQDAIKKNVVFGDFRLMGDNQDAEELNAGLGYRQLINDPVIGRGVAGGMIWFDRRNTGLGNDFNQITLGAEWLTEDWDVRLNGYLPINKDANFTRANPNGSGATLIGNQIVVNTDQTVKEEALGGFDLEFGVRVPYLDDYTDSTRVYAAGFHFEGDDAESVSGWRTRVASDITSNVQIGARYQHDDVRGSQGFLEATLRFPFNMKTSYRDHGLYSRMDESPERDIDIVSNIAVVNDGLNVPLVNATSGTTQNIIHVDNTASAGGDGSNEARFDTLAAAEAAAGANDIIYVHRGDGTTTGQNAGITIDDDGQQLIGSGVDLTFDASTFTTSNGLPVALNSSTNTLTLINKDPLGAPTITNGAGNGVVITSDNTIIQGMKIDGPTNNGISLLDGNNAIIDSNEILNTGAQGIGAELVSNINYNLTIENNIISSPNNNSIFLNTENSANLNGSLSDNVISNSPANGMFIFVENNSAMSLDINNNRITNIALTGIIFDTRNNSAGKVQIENNFVDTVDTFTGIALRARDDSNINNSIVRNNSVSNVTGNGINADTLGGNISSITNLLIEGNTSTKGSLFGIRVRGLGNGELSGTIRNNKSTQNEDGINLDYRNSTFGSFKLEGNIVTDNTTDGVFINDVSTRDDIFVDLGGGTLGSTGGNIILSNAGDDISVDLDGRELKAENNWWGSATGVNPLNINLRDSIGADTDPFLTERPD